MGVRKQGWRIYEVIGARGIPVRHYYPSGIMIIMMRLKDAQRIFKFLINVGYLSSDTNYEIYNCPKNHTFEGAGYAMN